MADPIILKKSGIPNQAPQVTDLEFGEIAINYADGKIYYKNTNNQIAYVETAEAIVGDVSSAVAISNVLYVAKNGSDASGTGTLAEPYLTLRKACEVAVFGTTIYLMSGDYTEINPISVPAGVTIVGSNLRSTTVRPLYKTQDILHVRNRFFVTGITFRDHLAPAAAVAFPPLPAGLTLTQAIAADPGRVIITSPYVQNCSSITFSATVEGVPTAAGAGMRIDGNLVGGLKSMVVDAYTQYNQSAARYTYSAGSFVVGNVYKIETLGTTDFTLIGAASNTIGLQFIATGVGTGTGTASTTLGGMGVHITNGGYAQLVSLFTICTSTAILCELGGQCSVTNSNCSFGDYGLVAKGVLPTPVDTGTTVGTTSLDTVVLTGLTKRPAVNDTVKFAGDSEYYIIISSTPLVAGQSTVTLERAVVTTKASGTVAELYRISFITSSGHTFEYVGAGCFIQDALPSGGGIPIQENEIVEDTGGKVFFTSTDHKGDFRIGNELLFNRATGTITGRTFERSMFAILTPYILAIEG